MLPTHAEITGTCAACGAQTTTFSGWVRLHDTLLCPGCYGAIATRSEQIGRSLSRAERDWERLWLGADDVLDGTS